MIFPSPDTVEKLAPNLNTFLRKEHFPLQMRLDLVDVFCRLRPAARILVRPGDEAEEVCQAILSVGYYIAVGKGIKWQPKSSTVTCHDWFSKKSHSTIFESMAVLYVADSQFGADQTRAADETKDDMVFARALGYPSCCIEWVSIRKCVPELSECIELYAAEGSYDPLVWPGAMLNDASLTPHYPCSTGCEQSQALARARVELLLKLGRSEILERIIRAREMVYFVDSQQKLRAASIADFTAGNHLSFVKPSISASERLNIAR